MTKFLEVSTEVNVLFVFSRKQRKNRKEPEEPGPLIQLEHVEPQTGSILLRLRDTDTDQEQLLGGAGDAEQLAPPAGPGPVHPYTYIDNVSTNPRHDDRSSIPTSMAPPRPCRPPTLVPRKHLSSKNSPVQPDPDGGYIPMKGNVCGPPPEVKQESYPPPSITKQNLLLNAGSSPNPVEERWRFDEDGYLVSKEEQPKTAKRMPELQGPVDTFKSETPSGPEGDYPTLCVDEMGTGGFPDVLPSQGSLPAQGSPHVDIPGNKKRGKRKAMSMGVFQKTV